MKHDNHDLFDRVRLVADLILISTLLTTAVITVVWGACHVRDHHRPTLEQTVEKVP